jgi:hypothetical protein
VASYPIPDGGVCADIALARGDVYVTDTLLGRILRLGSGRERTLEVWSADPQLARGAFLRINGIAFGGARTLYTTNYRTGELFAVRIAPDGSAEPAELVLDAPMTNPDASGGAGDTCMSPRMGAGCHASTRAQGREP